jgi:EAL domain-containing protein (putative c-di-GMP-specific phosphodiesterase class I)/GGDEF domain-containing protein
MERHLLRKDKRGAGELKEPLTEPRTLLHPGSTIDSLHSLYTYREHLDELKQRLAADGFLALLLIDVSAINQVERDHGSLVYDRLLDMVREVVTELQGRQLRTGDIVALNETAGDVFLVFLAPRKEEEHPLAEDIEKIGERVETYLVPRISQTAFSFLRKRTDVYVGTSLVLHNPLVRAERLVMRAIQEAHQDAQLNHHRRALRNKKQLQRIILQEQITTLFQPIYDMETLRPHGFEALCRGPKGTEFHSPLALFDTAEKSELLFELDHLCRRKALMEAGGKRGRGLPREFKLFINTLPFSMRDPHFQGKDLITLLGDDLSPDQIVFEVTEQHAIANYHLFRDAMKYFQHLRCLIAIDDMGAGYSGLDKIVELQPNYVKLDMSMVRDIHTSFVKKEMVQTFKAMADKIDAKLIAEGIEKREEFEVVREIGVNYIQGNYLARPLQGFQSAPFAF